MIKRFLTIGALVSAAAVALLLVTGVSTTGTAVADSSTSTPAPTPIPTATPDPLVKDTVSTNATIGGGTTGAPVIECKWELPDMQPGVTNGTYPDGRIQYGTASDAHAHDDDMAQVPDADNNPANGIQVPCTLQTVGGVTMPSMPNNVQDMIQVVPVPQDTPEARHVQLWMAVDAPDISVLSAFWQVFEPAPATGPCPALPAPDGSIPPRVWDPITKSDMCEKIQVHGDMVPKSACSPNSAQTLGDAPAVGKMWEAAVHTGQITAAAVDDPNYGMNFWCSEGAKGIFYSSFDVSKEQPCGQYRIDATASGGGTTTLSNYIDVECIIYLKIDFNAINWGTLAPFATRNVHGNTVWEAPNSVAPTVRNVGNDGMGVSVIFSQMTGAQFGKHINKFDACFGKRADAPYLECIDPIAAGVETKFGVSPLPYPTYPAQQILCSDEDGKLDVSVHATDSTQPTFYLPNDVYSGTLTVIGRHVSGICQATPGNQEPDGP
jgi:hypothetical protein